LGRAGDPVIQKGHLEKHFQHPELKHLTRLAIGDPGTNTWDSRAKSLLGIQQ